VWFGPGLYPFLLIRGRVGVLWRVWWGFKLRYPFNQARDDPTGLGMGLSLGL